MPDDRQVGTEDATEGLEDGVRAEGNVEPCEVGVSVAEDDSKTDGRDDTGADRPVR